MQAAFKTKLRANSKQATYLNKACGTSRFVWNWGLAEWREQYKQHRDGKLEKAPNWMALKKQFNAIKHEQYPDC